MNFYWTGNITGTYPTESGMTSVGTSWSSQSYSNSKAGTPLLTLTEFGFALADFGAASMDLSGYSFTLQAYQTLDVAQVPGKSCLIDVESSNDATDFNNGTWTARGSHTLTVSSSSGGPTTFTGSFSTVSAKMVRIRVVYTSNLPTSPLSASIVLSAFTVSAVYPTHSATSYLTAVADSANTFLDGSVQFTYTNYATSSPGGGTLTSSTATYALEDSNDASSWASVTSGSLATGSSASYSTVSGISYTGKKRYLRLKLASTVNFSADGKTWTNTLRLSDWRVPNAWPTSYPDVVAPVLSAEFCSVDGTLIQLTWTHSSGCEGFRVYRDGVLYFAEYSQFLRTVTFSGQTAGETHTWTVRAFSGALESADSNEITGYTNYAPVPSLSGYLTKCGRFHVLTYSATGYGDSGTIVHDGLNDAENTPVYYPNDTDTLVTITDEGLPSGAYTYTLRAHEVPMPQGYTFAVSNSCGSATAVLSLGPNYTGESCEGTVYLGSASGSCVFVHEGAPSTTFTHEGNVVTVYLGYARPTNTFS